MIALCVAGGLSNANAATQVYQGNTGWYQAGQTLNFTFNGPTYVERLLISASGYYSFTMAQVYADGDFVANLGVPGRDPVYPVIIRKKVTNIAVTFQGSVNISDFKVFANETHNSWEQSDISVQSSDSVAELAGKASQVVEFLQARLSMKDFDTYLKPIRKSALLLEASASGRNSTSEFTKQKAVQLITAIKNAEKMLDRMMDSSYYSQSALSLLTVKEALERKYDIQVVNVAPIPTVFSK